MSSAHFIVAKATVDYQFDDGLEEFRSVDECVEARPIKCRCARRNIAKRSPGANCNPVPSAEQYDGNNGWCYLEHVGDPANPGADCFPDAVWSASAGRFWSLQACKPAGNPPEEDLEPEDSSEEDDD